MFQDKIDIKGYSFEKYKHFLPIGKLGGYDVGFDNIVFSKSKKSFSHSAFGISNLAFKNNYIDLKVKQADFQIAPLEILSRNVLQSISPVKDLYLKINMQEVFKKDNNKKLPSTKNLNSSGDYIKEIVDFSSIFGKHFTNFISKYSNLIDNKIVVENAKVILDFGEIFSKREFKVLNSKTTFLNKNEKVVFSQTMNKLTKYLKEKDGESNKFSGIAKRGFLLLNRDSFKVLSSKTTFAFGDKRTNFNLLCNIEFQNKTACVADIDNLSVDVFGVFFKEYIEKIGLKNVLSNTNFVDAEVLFKIESGNFSNMRLKISLNMPEGLDIGDFNSSVEKIDVFLDFDKNFNQIISSEVRLNNKDGSSIKFNLDDFSVKKNNPSFAIKAEFNDIDLSSLLQLNAKNITDKEQQIPVKGKINGALSLFFKNGRFYGSLNEISNLSLSNFSFSLFGTSLDFSRMNFSVNIVENKVVFVSKKSDEKGNCKIEYNLLERSIKIDFEKFKIDKTDFRNFRDLLAMGQSKFLLDDIDYSSLLKGSIYLPMHNGSPKWIDAISNLKLFISEEDVFKYNNDNFIVKITKTEESKNWSFIIDFANAKMQSSLYKFWKSRKDNSAIMMDVVLDEKNDIGLKGVWKFNDEDICAFDASKRDKVAKVNVDGKRFGVNISIGEGNDNIKISGENINIDKMFAKFLTFLVQKLVEHFTTEEDIIVEIDVKKALLEKIGINKIFAKLKVNRDKVSGDCLMSFEDRDTVYYSNNGDGFKFYASDLTKILHVFGLAEELSSLRIEASGKINSGNELDKNNENNFGKLAVNMEYNGANLFKTTRPSSIYSDKLKFIDGGVEMLDTKISGNWFDIIADVKADFDGAVKLEGKIRPYLPSDRFKQLFVKKKEMTKDVGYKILKQGKNIDEFNRSFIVNDIDFSIDEDGNEKQSFTSWVMDQG